MLRRSTVSTTTTGYKHVSNNTEEALARNAEIYTEEVSEILWSKLELVELSLTRHRR
jgi:hypothetical protein